MTEMCGKTLAVLDDERMTCRIGAYEETLDCCSPCTGANEGNLDYCSPCIGANEENLDYCSPYIGANEETLDRSSPGKLAWYFAQPSIPGLIHLATINGYVASGPDKTKGGKEDV